jgi:tetratricopeptide (TPR) repeat protein
MPSLKNLDAFATLFHNIGGEADTLAERGQSPDVMKLPDKEPEPLPLSGDTTSVTTGTPIQADKQDDAADKALPEDFPEDINLDDLLAGIPAETEKPPETVSGTEAARDTGTFPDDEASELEPSNNEGAGIKPDFHFGDYAQPIDEDLSPLSIDNALPDGFEGDVPETGAAFTPEDFKLEELDVPFEETASDAGNTVPEAIPGPQNADEILDSFDSADTIETLPPADDSAVTDSEPGGFDTLDTPEELPVADAPDQTLEELPTTDEDIAIADESPAANKPVDPFDSFDFADSNDTTAKKPEASGEFADLDDFIIPGIDTPIETARTGGAGKEPQEKVEDIELSEEEFARLEETLQAYPLNLRLACEEAIVETAATPAQLSPFIKLLVRGGSARDAAKLVGKILGKEIVVPRGFQKQTGAELEAEQASFAYIFVKKFLPMFGLVLFIAGTIAGMVYLGWNLVYKPLKAESVYQIGLERIAAGEYERANERFNEAWRWKPIKEWFYTYAEAFRDARQYFYAEEKYDQLIAYTASRNKKGIPEEKGVLDYARMETGYLRDYEKADRLVRNHILDWNPDDPEGLLALGDINLAWGDANVEFSDEGNANRDGGKYEIARQNYARHLELYGWADPVLERMLLYFIRADDLSEILPLHNYFMSQKKLTIRPSTLSETGAYLLDKQIEETRYVRDADIEKIEGVRDTLLRAADADPFLPEPHYHLARYYAMIGEQSRERQYLENASRLFDNTREENAQRIRARIDTEQRVSHAYRDRREFFSAEERLVKAANLYEDALERRVFRPAARFAGIYADLGDLEYFTKFSDDSRLGNWQEAITYYLRAEESGYSTPEMQYRLGSSYYHLSDFRRAEERFFEVSTQMPTNRRVLNALGNVSFLLGNFSVAESYFSKLVSMLQADRLRITEFRIDDVPEHRELIERLMIARNNLGATYQTLAERDGNNRHRTRALALYSDASRIWDNLARDPATFVRPGLADLSVPTVSLPYLNTRNVLYPTPGAAAEIFINIDRDMLEPSPWEYLMADTKN